jgi:hypothetical protein
MPQIAAAMITAGIKRPSPIEYLVSKTALTGTSGPLDHVLRAGQKSPDVSSYRIMVSIW